MKTLKRLTGAIALMLALLFGASNVVVAAETVHLYLKMTGKVIRDNQSGKTFTVMAEGKEVTFSAAKLKALPKVGEIIDITYTATPGGPMEATTINTTKSNTF